MYYPKSQIKTDLYTNGGEFVTSNDGVIYQGYYFSTSDGLYFTGRNPNNKPNFPLTLNLNSSLNPVISTSSSFSEVDSFYNYPIGYSLALSSGITNTSIPPSLPTQTIVLPTKEDYKITEYQRYFVKKSNEIIYIEISQEEYKKYIDQDINVSYQLYIPFTLPWVISGNRNDVYNVNKKTIERIQSNGSLQGFKSYFKNRYDQYFKYSASSNLTTDGTEFLNESTGKRYVGLYHIHPEKGPMVGAEHIPQIHDYLIPVSGSNTNYRVNNIETQNSQNPNTRYVGY
jgi:hypothetical protein